MLSPRSPITPLAAETTISAAAELARTASSTNKQPTSLMTRLSRFFSASLDDLVTAGTRAAPESAASAALTLVSTASSAELNECSSAGTVSSWAQTYDEFGMKIKAAFAALAECDENCTCDSPSSSPASSPRPSLSSAASSPRATRSNRTHKTTSASSRSSRSTRSNKSLPLDIASDSSDGSAPSWAETYNDFGMKLKAVFTECDDKCACDSPPSSPASSRASSLSSAASSRIFESDSDSLVSDAESMTTYEATSASASPSTRSSLSSRPSRSPRNSGDKLLSYGSPHAEHFDLITVAAREAHERRCRERKSLKPRGDNNFGKELYPRMPASEMYALKYDLRRQQLQPHVDELEKRKGRRVRASDAFELKYTLLTPDVAQQPKKLSERIAQIRETYARENQLHEQIGGRRMRASEVPAFYCPQPLPEYCHYGMRAEVVDYNF